MATTQGVPPTSTGSAPACWTVGPGRNIYRDGEPCVRIVRSNGSVFSPEMADDVADLIVDLFNATDRS